MAGRKVYSWLSAESPAGALALLANSVEEEKYPFPMPARRGVLGLSRSGWEDEIETPCFGKFEGSTFRLRTRKKRRLALGRVPYDVNTLAPFFFGAVDGAKEGTKIRGSFKVYPPVRFWEIAMWMIAICLVAGATVFTAADLARGDPSSLRWLAFFVGFSALIFWFSWYGRRIGKEEEREIVEFLSKLFGKPRVRDGG